MDPYKNAIQFLKQIQHSVKKEDIPYFKRLLNPHNIIKGDIEVIMDNGSVKKFPAYRSQHNNALGPYKGGVRFHENVTESEVKALSLWMTLKCSIAGLPYGGGKGGVVVDPKELSRRELEQLSRGYTRLIAEHIGSVKDIPAPDVNTDKHIMAWMLDEYEKVTGNHEPAVITGKPILLGGSRGRVKATGYGGVIILELLIEKLQQVCGKKDLKKWFNKPRSQITIAVQGFGNVGYYFAKTASDKGFRVVAISDSKGGIYVEEGIDPAAALKCKKEHGNITLCHCAKGVCMKGKGKRISNEKLLELDVDILVPSALENVITKKNAKRIKAPVVIEMANGPIAPEADKILAKNGIVVVPDILANSGGVSVSYLEWVQNRTGFYWDADEVDEKLHKILKNSFHMLWKKYNECMEGKKTSETMRKIAYILSVERIIKVEKLRRPL